jgi:hypothetical protein
MRGTTPKGFPLKISAVRMNRDGGYDPFCSSVTGRLAECSMTMAECVQAKGNVVGKAGYDLAEMLGEEINKAGGINDEL